jgi:extradiol dioxygenase family protein
MSVELANGVVLDYDEREDFVPNHYAFGVGEDELDAIHERVRGRGIEFYAYPGHHRAGEVRPNPRGFYFSDPDGHNMEVLVASRPSGNG